MLLLMQITLAHIGSRSAGKEGVDLLIQTYLQRCEQFARCRTEGFKTEEALLEWLERRQGRTPALAVLLDSRGPADELGGLCCVAGRAARRGEPADGFCRRSGQMDGQRRRASRANLLLSLGPMTLAHALARLVMAEQIYRAYTILTGHPYHAGH